jgi:hypothetical protein
MNEKTVSISAEHPGSNCAPRLQTPTEKKGRIHLHLPFRPADCEEFHFANLKNFSSESSSSSVLNLHNSDVCYTKAV